VLFGFAATATERSGLENAITFQNKVDNMPINMFEFAFNSLEKL